MRAGGEVRKENIFGRECTANRKKLIVMRNRPVAAEAGLCATCKHVQMNQSDRGSVFYFCRLSMIDPQFPVLLRYRILEGPIHPYITAGPSVQMATNITETDTIINSMPVVSHPPPERRAVAGVAAGAGLGFSFGRLHISPEIRYTRWAAENFDFTQSNHVGTKLNQVQILVAVMF